MARRSVAAQSKVEPISSEFVFDPDNLIPPSQVPAPHKDAYWTQLMAIPGLDHLRAAVATEEFFSLLREIPKAFWEKRFFVYLYRTSPKVKNADKNRYIDKYPFPLDEAMVKEEHGGGGYLAYLNIDSKEQLKQITFDIDGPPKFKVGQTLVDAAGTPLPITSVAAQPQPSETSQIMSAASDIMKKATEGAIALNDELTRKSLGLTPAPENKFQDKLLEILLTRMNAEPKPPAVDPVQQELMKAIIAKAFAEPKQNPEQSEKASPLSDTLAVIKDLTGAESIAELMKPAARAVAADVTPAWVSPLIQIGQTFVAALPAIMAQSRATRDMEFRRMLFLRDSKPGQQIPQNLLTEAAPAQAAQPQPAQPPAAPGRNEVVQAIVARICTGFDRHRDTGADVAAAISVELGEHIEAFGLERALTDSDEMTRVVMEQPQLAQAIAQRSTHAKWKDFADSFNDYMQDRWGQDGDQDEVQDDEQPPAA